MSGPEETSKPPPGRVELLAHDVRAALADVVGGLRLLGREPLGSEARTQLERVMASSELLSRLIDEVLDDRPDAIQGETGAVADLRRLIEDELKRWRGAALPQGIAVTQSLSADLPRLIRAEALPLRRILANAMSNALRFAVKTVALDARVTPKGAIEVSIRDDGPGFEPGLLPHLFEPAKRGQHSPGTGLGLHIAAGHAAAMRGQLSARNRPEGGAEIRLTLPASLSQTPLPGLSSAIDMAGWRVLIADDSQTVQALLAGMLAQLGAECEQASDGIVALNWLARERFDLAIVDVEMPLLSGREVIRAERLRQARGIAPPTPLLALTAHSGSDIRETLLDDGADGVLMKPLPDTQTLGRMLAGILDLKRARPDWRPEAAPVLSAATLSELLAAAGPEHAAEMLDRMRDDLANVEIQLEQALVREDPGQVKFHAHVLVSLSGAVGALPTLALARRLSDLSRAQDWNGMRITAQVALARLRELRHELDRVTAPEPGDAAGTS